MDITVRSYLSEYLKTSQFIQSLKYLFSRIRQRPLLQNIQVFLKAFRYSASVNFKYAVTFLTVLFLFLTGLLVVGISSGIELSMMTRDPNAVFNNKPYVGFLSNMGIFLWASTVAICWFTARLIRKQEESKLVKAFLDWSGLITLLLAFDDVFQLHEYLFPVYFGINEKYYFLIYFALLLVYFTKFYKILLNKNLLIIVLAGLFFITSMIIDEMELWVLRYPTFIEDGFKFVGISFWTYYFLKNIYEGFSINMVSLKKW